MANETFACDAVSSLHGHVDRSVFSASIIARRDLIWSLPFHGSIHDTAFGVQLVLHVYYIISADHERCSNSGTCAFVC